MNVVTTLIFTAILLYFLDKYIPNCTKTGEPEYRYIPRTINHHVNDASESTNDMIRSMINGKGNIWLDHNKIA